MVSADGDISVTLSHDGRDEPVSSWASIRPDTAAALAQIMATVEDERCDPDGRPMVEISDTKIVLRPAFTADLDAASAAAIGLPPATPLALELRPIGRIDQDDFRIETRWVEPGGHPARAKVEGALLTASSGPRRLPNPLWALYRATQALSGPLDRTDRFRVLSEIRELWPVDPRAPVESDAYLKDLRVHYASSLSLKLRTLTPDQTDFDPVLFGGRALQDSEDGNRSLDEDLDNVLTPAAQRLFANDRFRREPDARPVYVLRDGEYIYIDPSLRPALDAVRKLQDRPEAERREFVLNPRRVLREIIGDREADETGLDDLFVETEQFSARVAGVDIWRAPVLPWLAPSGKNQWLPERFGLRIGDDYFAVPPANVAPLLKKVQDAAVAGEMTVPVSGLLEPAKQDGPAPPEQIAVNDQVVSALQGLEPLAAAAVDGEANPNVSASTVSSALRGKLFLVVRDNLDEVEFAPFGSSGEDETAPYEPFALPRRLHTTLKPHQVEGLNWLARSVGAKRPGALLADDMGLGKTLQAIALMAWLQEEALAGRRSPAPFLIVAPTGLLGTWRDEIAKHLDMPRLGPMVPAFGTDLKSLREDDGFSVRDIESGRAALRAEAWRDAGVVLTTYETLRDYHFSFARTRFDLVIYDEIQKLKNPASQLTRASKALNSSFTLGMTGTPVENRLQDLWSIMDVIAPGMLGSSRDFEKRYPADNPVALGRLKSLMTEPREAGPAYMLRRLKADALAGLPSKHIHSFEVAMPPVQASAYHDIVVRAAASSAAGAVGKGGMLSTLSAMRGVSLHPLDPRQAPADLDVYASDSARLSQTLKILDEIAAKREKALIFVEDLAMQERLAGLIQSRFKLPTAPTRINGAVPGPKRQSIVDRFQRDRDRFDVMILSPKAGGVGLTLTSANHVIHLSRWWNPAVEDQATDRVFRIGQTRDVHVYLPLAVHPDPSIRDSSFDLRLNALIERKRKLTRDLFLPPDAADSELSDLFREVSLGGEAPSSEVPEVAEPVVAEPIQSPARPILSISKVLSDSGIRRWRCEAGQPRPTDAIISIFAGKHLSHVIIRDPYALVHPNARSAQVRFLALLRASSRGLEAATVEYDPDARDDVDDAAVRRDFGTIFSQAFPTDPPRLALIRRRKRSRDDDFHDRFVEFDVRHVGGATRRHELTIGRGVEALFDMNKQCTATYAPPSDYSGSGGT
jgi:superfamily II DNA or RNA helicase